MYSISGLQAAVSTINDLSSLQLNGVVMSDSMSEQSSFASDGSRDLSISENEEQSPSPPKPTRPRPSRQRTLPAKLREAELDVRSEEITLDMTSK